MCSGRSYESTDVQHELFRSGHDLDFRSNFQNNLLRSNYSSFNASQEEKYDAGKMNAVPLPSQKLLQKSLLQKRLFLEFLLSGDQTVDLRSNLRAHQRKSVNPRTDGGPGRGADNCPPEI